MLDKLKNYRRSRLSIFLIAIGLLIIVNVVYRIGHAIALSNSTKDINIVRVRTINATKGPRKEEVMLPGNLQAWHESPLFSRTNGYVREWYVDIGSIVKKNDLLAIVETPEVNEQLNQAEADLARAITQNDLAQITANRYRILGAEGVVSRQTADEQIHNAQAAADLVKSAQANRERLYKLAGFEQIRAPFDGIITQRNTDIGNLINAGSSTTQNPIFRLAQVNRLRLYVKIPQEYTADVSASSIVKLKFNQFPNEVFYSKLARNAKALDPNTRTLLTEYEVNNPKNRFFSGAYTQVLIQFAIPSHVLRLPVNTLLFRGDGLLVATVNHENKIQLKTITLGRDFGNEFEVTSGITTKDRIIVNPPDGAYNGQAVEVVK